MESIFILFAGTFISLVFLGLLFIPMEKMFSAKKNQPIFRKNWILDLTFFLGQYFIFSFLILFFLQFINSKMNDVIPIEFRTLIHSQPNWLQAIEVLILSDFLIYWAHRFQHKNNFLWRFHKVHHSAEHLDWLAAHREHPIDTVYTVGIINLPAIIFGFSLESITAIVIFRGIWAIYIHSNVRLNIGIIKKLIGSPDIHHWHHELERDRGNYANISPIMDIIFGTYTCPETEPTKVGIKETFPKNYLGQLLEPIIGKKNYRHLHDFFRKKHA